MEEKQKEGQLEIERVINKQAGNLKRLFSRKRRRGEINYSEPAGREAKKILKKQGKQQPAQNVGVSAKSL